MSLQDIWNEFYYYKPLQSRAVSFADASSKNQELCSIASDYSLASALYAHYLKPSPYVTDHLMQLYSIPYSFVSFPAPYDFKEHYEALSYIGFDLPLTPTHEVKILSKAMKRFRDSYPYFSIDHFIDFYQIKKYHSRPYAFCSRTSIPVLFK